MKLLNDFTTVIVYQNRMMLDLLWLVTILLILVAFLFIFWIYWFKKVLDIMGILRIQLRQYLELLNEYLPEDKKILHRKDEK